MDKRKDNPSVTLVGVTAPFTQGSLGSSPVAVGDTVRFVMFEGIKGEGAIDLRQEVEGVVESINPKHRTFTVRYGDPTMRTCFQFFDIDKTVFLIP